MDQVSRSLLAVGGSALQQYTDDVFSTWLYTGTGAAQTITNGIDLAGKGGMVWLKGRSGATDHAIYDTARGATFDLTTTSTAAQTAQATGVTAFGATGFTFGALAKLNTSAAIYAAWAFRKAPKFFDVVTYTGDGAANRAIPHSLGVAPGFITSKATSTTGNWNCYHKDASGDLVLNTTAAQTASRTLITAASASTFTVSGAANTNAVSYVAYLFAHDTAADGLIQCGVFTTDANRAAVVDTGWEPQFLLVKGTATVSNWTMLDSIRGFTANAASNGAVLNANATSTEALSNNPVITATGFYTNTNTSTVAVSSSYVYIAIRRPNKPPSGGAQIFQPTRYTGTNTDNQLLSTVIAPDLVMLRQLTGSGAGYEGFVVGDRLRGQSWLKTGVAQAETTTADGLDQQLVGGAEYGTSFSSMNGVWIGNNTGATAAAINVNANTTANNHVALAFKRAPGVFDACAIAGTSNIRHSLGAQPELVFLKKRASPDSWWVYHKDAPSQMFTLNTQNAAIANTVFGAPTATVVPLTLSAEGGVASVSVTNGGTGYTSAPSVSFSGGGGSGASATANLVFDYSVYNDGFVSSVTLTAGGANYLSAPSVSFSGGGGTGASASTTLSASPTGGAVSSVTVTDPGSRYTSAPSVSFSGGGGTGAAATANMTTYRVVTSINITNGGSGYSSPPTVVFSGGGGSGASATASNLYRVTTITVTNQGQNYSNNLFISLAGGSRTAGTETLTATVVGGKITAISYSQTGDPKWDTNAGTGLTVTINDLNGTGSGATAVPNTSGFVANVQLDAGGEYSTTPTISFSGGGGSGAAATAGTTAYQRVSTITVTNGGSGYTSEPTITISGPTGSPPFPPPATAVANMTYRYSVESITLNSGGSGYTSAPTVSISGGGGSGATATAAVDLIYTDYFKVSSVTVNAAGAYYTTAPTVSFSGGGGTGAAATSALGTLSFGSYVAYLFASLPGISKVGTYTGNGGAVNTAGTSQTINCGFTTGARFILVKRTDSTGDWYVFDTARGVAAANDPYLLLNGTAAEVTTVDGVDPDNSGFVVNQTSGTNLNVTGATYLYLAIA